MPLRSPRWALIAVAVLTLAGATATSQLPPPASDASAAANAAPTPTGTTPTAPTPTVASGTGPSGTTPTTEPSTDLGSTDPLLTTAFPSTAATAPGTTTRTPSGSTPASPPSPSTSAASAVTDGGPTAPTTQPGAADPSPGKTIPRTPIGSPGTFHAGRYIVTMTKLPLASYAGGLAGIPGTTPAAGDRLSTDSANAQRYAAVLEADQHAAAASVGVVPASSFTVALNGFTADLTASQARRLSVTPGVQAVSADRMNYVRNDASSTDFLTLSGSDGTWAAVGGAAQAGRGVVIGVIDTGIWPENPSFYGSRLTNGASPYNPALAYRDGDRTVMVKADGHTFTGACQAGQQFTATDCTTKIISARYFGDSFFEMNGGSSDRDFVSPRDADGHGSHTAGTAAGASDVPVTIDGVGYGSISGVAPGASLAIYKALWEGATDEASGGADSDIVAAIEQAVIDGVDVLNYSAGRPTESDATDPVALAFLSAAAAGIFVSAAAGNDGPGRSTADNTQPWETTVAASTIGPREGTVELGDGAKFSGASNTVLSPVGPAALVAGELSGLPGAAAEDAAQCAPDTLDPARVTGTIVQCDRGTVDRVAKSAEVARAGGIGMVLTDLVAGSTDADLHSVPTVHVDVPGGPAIRAYATEPGATVTLLPGNDTGVVTPYPQIATSSSRGPARSAAGDILKPDIAAPGVSILAPVAPPGNKGRSWDFYSGTSMAAPQISGLAAIYTRQHPEWSPMAVKSALMTTSYSTRNADGTVNTDPFAQGAGEVDPNRMLGPGLVYDAGSADWLGYLEGLGVDTGTGTAPIDAADYNQASIAVGAVLGPRTVTRTVTAVAPGSYQASVAVPGFDAVVSPDHLDFTAAGQTAAFTVTFTATTAPFDSFASGTLTWTDGDTGGTVRSPIAVRPVAVGNTPAQVLLGGTDTAAWTVTSGVTGDFPISTFGMSGGDPRPGRVSENDVARFTVEVPAGTKIARFSTELADPGSDADLEVTVFHRSGAGEPESIGVRDFSGTENAVDVIDPEPGTYTIEVFGFFDAAGTNATPYTFRNYLVQPVADTQAPTALTVRPAGIVTTAGAEVTLTASATGLRAGEPYLGWVGYPDGSGSLVVAPGAR